MELKHAMISNSEVPEMQAMTNAQQEMIEYTTQDIVAYMMEDQHLEMNEAMDLFYTSDTFEKLADVETGLYLQGSSYVYELFKREKPKL